MNRRPCRIAAFYNAGQLVTVLGYWRSLPVREIVSEWPLRPRAPDLADASDAIRRVQAKLAGCDLPPVLGHADWEAQNMRWRHGEAHAVHDWDGLAWLPEAAIAGSAAGIFAQPGQDSTRAARKLRSLPSRLRKRTRRPLLALRDGDRLGGEHLGSSPQRSRRTGLQRPKPNYEQSESTTSRTTRPSRRLSGCTNPFPPRHASGSFPNTGPGDSLEPPRQRHP